jgi:hypothetical protein
MDELGLPHLDNPSHIIPLMVGEATLCKQVCDMLLDRYDIYVQPINYPTVPVGTERLRITPSPLHSEGDIDHLINALDEIWTELRLDRRAPGGSDDDSLPAIDPALAEKSRRAPARSYAGAALFESPEEPGWLTRLLARFRPETSRRAYS